MRPSLTTRLTLLSASDAALQAFVSSLGALIDVSRRVVGKQPVSVQTEYATRVSVVVQIEGAGLFKGLRNYLLHVSQAPWVISTAISGGRATVSITIDTQVMLRWDGWNAKTGKYLRGAPSIALGALVKSYRDTLRELYVWLAEAIQIVHAAEIAAANELIRQRNLTLTDGRFEDQASFMASIEKSVAEWHASKPPPAPGGGPALGPDTPPGAVG